MSSLSAQVIGIIEALPSACGLEWAALCAPGVAASTSCYSAGAAPAEPVLQSAARAALLGELSAPNLVSRLLDSEHVLVRSPGEHPALSALEAALRAALRADRAQRSIDKMSDGLVLLAEDGRCVYINERAASRLGIKAISALGEHLWKIGDAALIQRAWVMAKAEGGGTFPALHPSSGAWWEISATRSPDQISVLIRDIDPSRQMARVESLIGQVGELIQGATTPQQVLAAAAGLIQRVGGWTWAETWLAESNQGPLRLQTISAPETDDFVALRERSKGLRFERGEGAPWRAVQAEDLIFEELDERFVRLKAAHEAGMRYGMFMPIVSGERIFGVLGFMHHTPLISYDWKAVLTPFQTRLSRKLGRQIEWLESQLLFDLSHDLILILGVDGTIRRANASLEEALGWDYRQLGKNALFELAHPQDVALLRLMLSQLELGSQEEQISVRMRHARGGYRWIAWRARSLTEHRIVYAIGRDTTDQQRAAASLVASEQRFRLLARATTDAVWDWELTTDKRWWGEGYTTLFGYAHPGDHASLESSWARYVHPEDRERILRSLRAAADGEASDWREEYRFICADGRVAWVMDRGYVIRDARGEALRMVGGMTDLTERKEAELQRAWQAELLDQTVDAILVERLDGAVRYWNRAASVVFGLSVEQVLGNPLRGLLPMDHDALDKIRAQVVARGLWTGEVTIPRPGGKDQVLDTRWTLLHNEAGEPRELLLVATDISQRKQIELQYLRAQRLESVGTLAGGIAHDLNNILTPIMMSASLLKMELEGGDPEHVELVGDISKAAKRGAEIIQQILTFARGAEGRRAPLDPAALLRDVERIGRESFMRTIEIVTDMPDTLPAVLGDATQLHQVLLNLMINARDAMPEGGKLTLSAEPLRLDESYALINPNARAGDYIVISVSDTGMGIDAGIRDRIFEPFFTTKPLGQGTGLGLSTVMAIIRGHDGFVHLYTELGRGTTFKLYIPTISADLPLRESTPKPLPRGEGELILLVDDEPSILGTTRQMLEAFGYRVMMAGDGADALATFAVNKEQIAVVLTDVMMPFMDGIAMARAILRMKPDAKIIAASGLNAPGTSARLSDVGVRHFLPKPFTADILLTTLREVIESSKG